MDDANFPNLIGLPLMGFTDISDEVYINTRKMALSSDGNPYYIFGSAFQGSTISHSGIGSPHTGLTSAWPISLCIAIMTSNSSVEIKSMLNLLMNSTAGLGLMHESVDVNSSQIYSRNWFSWANG